MCVISDVFRRSVDISERNYLREHGVVSEMQCDLGAPLLVLNFLELKFPFFYAIYIYLLAAGNVCIF